MMKRMFGRLESAPVAAAAMARKGRRKRSRFMPAIVVTHLARVEPRLPPNAEGLAPMHDLTKWNSSPSHDLSMKVALTFFAFGISSGISAFAAEKPMAFFDEHCTDCHDADTHKGNLDLTALEPEFTNAETFARWVK